MNKKKVLITGVIAVVIILLILFNVLGRAGQGTGIGGQVFNVKTEKAEISEISSYVYSSGVVEAHEEQDVFVDTPVLVTDILARENQPVKKGQQIISLDMSSLHRELDKLLINKEIQELALMPEAKESELTRVENALKSAQRAYDDSKKSYEDAKKLYESNVLSKNELNAAEKAYSEAQRALENAKASYDAAVSGYDADLKTKKLNLQMTDMSITEIRERIERIEKAVYSPIDGVISRIHVKKDSYTGSMQPMYSVVNPDKLKIRAGVNEYSIKDVAPEQKVIITGDAIGESESVTGRVESVAPVAAGSQYSGGQENVVEVVISIDNTYNALKPGMNVSCDIAAKHREAALVVPMESIYEDKDGGKYIFVVDESNGTMKKVKASLGIFSDMMVEVLETEGLKEGDRVVMSPLSLYKDGSRVRITE